MLRNLNRPTDQWDDVIVFHTAANLPKDTRKAWEIKVAASTDPSTWVELEGFLQSRFRMLEATAASAPNPASSAATSVSICACAHIAVNNRLSAGNINYGRSQCRAASSIGGSRLAHPETDSHDNRCGPLHEDLKARTIQGFRRRLARTKHHLRLGFAWLLGQLANQQPSGNVSSARPNKDTVKKSSELSHPDAQCSRIYAVDR